MPQSALSESEGLTGYLLPATGSDFPLSTIHESRFTAPRFPFPVFLFPVPSFPLFYSLIPGSWSLFLPHPPYLFCETVKL